MGLVGYIPRWLYNIFKLIIYSIDSKWRFYYHVLLSKQTNHFLKSERYLKKKKARMRKQRLSKVHCGTTIIKC